MPICSLGSFIPTYSIDTVWVAPTAYVIGNVELGDDVGIWFGATIRGDNDPIKIGARSNVQESATLHTDVGFPLTVGEDVTIGHGAIVHGCSIGNNSLIGMGATILNGAKIGNNSIVGANALVTEGKEFPDNSLIVGSPARAVRQLDEAAIERLTFSAQTYVNNKNRFARDLKIIQD